MAIVQKRNHIITWNEKLEIQMIIFNHLYVCQGGGGGGGGGSLIQLLPTSLMVIHKLINKPFRVTCL